MATTSCASLWTKTGYTCRLPVLHGGPHRNGMSEWWDADPAPTLATTEAEREAIRQSWRDLSGSRMPPIATQTGRCPECKRQYGVIDGKLNKHSNAGLACKGGEPQEATPL